MSPRHLRTSSELEEILQYSGLSMSELMVVLGASQMAPSVMDKHCVHSPSLSSTNNFSQTQSVDEIAPISSVVRSSPHFKQAPEPIADFQ